MNSRIFFTLLLICLIPLIPWWAIMILVFGAMIFQANYWEGLIIFFLYDLVFGLLSGLLGTQFSFTIIFIVIFLLIEGLRDNLIFNNN